MHSLFLLTALVAGAASQAVPPSSSSRPYKPIVLESSGGFAVGGTVLHNPQRPNSTLSCDHGYLEYFLPWTRRATSLVMWHSSSTQVWQNRWDGGEGFKDMFLRRDYPVYLWDGPRVGRANWGCETVIYRPGYRDQGNFGSWNFGRTYPNWYNDTQFPRDNVEAWNQAVRARYDEMDTAANVYLQAAAAAVAADSGKVGKDIVYLTNSAGGLRALVTATRANGTNIRGIVAYECIGSIFPNDTAVLTQLGITPSRGGFGPFVVPPEDFHKLASLTAIQFVWGDHRDDAWPYVVQARQMADLINQHGGHAEVLMLGREVGLHGSSHIAFADMDNDKVAAMLDDFLARNKLDQYAQDDR
ncbi:hypothetical protein SCUCBS95973_005632 [Sporothrix curviconia]|uniref:Alpha/beta-hydrolase n=1 Tax=Sporothrix curviconia TaxID=1260050 RepID=A0ABP0BYX3_9PEZI